MFTTANADVLLLQPPDSLTDKQRTDLIHDFEMARAHLLFGFTLKTAAMEEIPLRAFAIAHHNRMIARESLQYCLASGACGSQHPKIIALQQGTIHDGRWSF